MVEENFLVMTSETFSVVASWLRVTFTLVFFRAPPKGEIYASTTGGDLNSSLSTTAASPAEARRVSGTKPAVWKEGGVAIAGGLAYF